MNYCNNIIINKEVPKFILTGPECTGKTTLAKRLAQDFKTIWNPEFVRTYLDKRFKYTQNYKIYHYELSNIVSGQVISEYHLAKQASKLLVCDTNILSNLVYIKYYFKILPTWLAELFSSNNRGFYILLSPTIPFEKDPQREDEQNREILFKIFKKTLETYKLPFIVIHDSEKEKRYKKVKNFVNKTLRDN